MKSINNHGMVLNLAFYKLLRLYNVFDPNGKTFFNYNLSRFTGFIYIIFVQCFIFFGTLDFFLETEHTIDITAKMTIWYIMICNVS